MEPTGAAAKPTWLDRSIGFFAPQAALRRMRARVAAELLGRHYEAASVGRRTQGWRASSGDANAVTGPALVRLREAARDLVRNNGYAEGAIGTIADDVVGWGIVAKPVKGKGSKAAAELWQAWAESVDCDSDGRADFYGLQHLVMRTVIESGECLVRRRFRRDDDGLAIPLQLQVLDPDHIDTLKTGIVEPNGRKIINGVEYDALGRRSAYWLFREHPGAMTPSAGMRQSYPVPAAEILHVFKQGRPGQVRGPSWFAPILVKFKDFDEFDDATLMKQKIAACLAVITSDVDGSAPALGVSSSSSPDIDSLEPGMILNVPPGRDIQVVSPPSVREYPEYCEVTLRAIATGLGVAYEDLTGDYTQMPFSAARMSRARYWSRVHGWRWRMLIPQFCVPAYRWAMQAAVIAGQLEAELEAEWTAPPPPMVDPAIEGQAYSRNIRNGLMSLSEALRERGYDPRAVLEEIAADNKLLDELHLVLDSDPRKVSQQGQAQATEPGEPEEPEGDEGGEPPKPPTPPAGDEDDDAAETAAARAHELAMAHARRPLAVNVAPAAPAAVTLQVADGAVRVDAGTTVAAGAVQVSAPTTIEKGAVQVDAGIEKGAIQVSAPTTIADGAIRTEVPLTIADTVEAPAGRTVFERDDDGLLVGFKTEGAAVVAVRDPDTRELVDVKGKKVKKRRRDDDA